MRIFRNKLLWIALVCAAPIVLGTAAYLARWSPGTPSNYGELVGPTPVPGLEPLRGKWLLVMFDAAACDARCEHKLYFIGQVRRAQGKDMGRVERLWVTTDGGKPRAEILPGIEGTLVYIQPDLAAVFAGPVVEHIYLVDPLGNLMMRFPRDPDPSRVIKDLQRLLRYSRFG